MWDSNYAIIDELINSKDPRREKKIITGEQRRNTRIVLAEMTDIMTLTKKLKTFVNVMLDADAVINNSSQKVGGSGPRKTHGINAPARR